MNEPVRPGLAKARPLGLARAKTRVFYASSSEAWRDLVASAEVLSEGGPYGEGETRAYFGSSSFLLLPAHVAEGASLELVVRLAASDPHLRVHVARCARREAAQRASGPLQRVRLETSFSAHGGGVLVRVDVEATVLPDRRKEPRPPLLTHDRPHANA